MSLPPSWRLLRTPPADGAWNMACDLALMSLARAEGVGILRVYEWSVPTISFGRHERTIGIYSAESLANSGLAAVRRPTGGRALLHSREVTYSVAIPIRDECRWTTAYDHVNARLLQAMRALNVPARIVPDDGAVPPNQTSPTPTPHAESHVCFSGIAPGEIAVEEKKLVASAVWRERGAFLQHGSILMHDDQSRLSPLLKDGATRPEAAAVLSDWLAPARSSADVFIAVEAALNEAFSDCGNGAPWSIPRNILNDVEVVRAQLIQPTWLWRR